MTSLVVQCASCKRLNGPMKCEAFDKIPVDVFFGRVMHTSSLPNDNGLIFVQKEGTPEIHFEAGPKAKPSGIQL